MSLINPEDAPVYQYSNSVQRWTWRKRKVAGVTVLSATRDAKDGQCCYFASLAALEANLRARGQLTPELSVAHLEHLDAEIRRDPLYRHIGTVGRILNVLAQTRVLATSDYQLPFHEMACHRQHYRISSFSWYHISKPRDIRRALETHLQLGPMVAVFRISSNFDDCILDDEQIYRFIEGKAMYDGKFQLVTHAVPVIGFGIYGRVPYLEFQVFARREHVPVARVDFRSVIELYGINI